MSYDLSIICDIRVGNRLEKKRCHSDAQTKIQPPRKYGGDFKDTSYALVQAAKREGWIHVKSPGVIERWVCPACIDTCSIPAVVRQRNVKNSSR